MQRSEKKTGTCYPDRRKIIVLQRKNAPGSPEWDFPEAFFYTGVPCRLNFPERPPAGTPSEEEGDSAEELIHHERDPAACQA